MNNVIPFKHLTKKPIKNYIIYLVIEDGTPITELEINTKIPIEFEGTETQLEALLGIMNENFKEGSFMYFYAQEKKK